MPGLEYSFVERVRRRLMCPLCRLPMRDPCQISNCGHRFCDTCLQEFLSEGIFNCPEDQLPLDYAKIYPDPEVQAEIMTSMIRCIHHQKGCRWVDKLAELQTHLDICRYDTVPCPNKCAAMLSKICLDDHLNYTCPRRTETCDICNKDFSGEAMESHLGNCPLEVVWCENKCGARLPRRYLGNHMTNECHKRTLPCRYCQKEFVYETMQDHYYQCPRFPLMCPNRCDPTKIPREEVEIHLKKECPSSAVPCSFKDVGCNAMVPRFGLEKHLDEAARQHLSMMCQLTLRQEKQIQVLTKQLQVMGRITDGTLLWKIHNYREKLAEAKKKGDWEIKSEPFYTSRYGYRLGASVFLDGNGSGEGTHMSMYIRVLQGEYDNLLEWPFKLPITFELLDQCSDYENRKNVIESFLPDPTWKHFEKPAQDVEPLGFGYPKFVSQEPLRTGTYVRDNAIFIKIKVDTRKFIMP